MENTEIKNSEESNMATKKSKKKAKVAAEKSAAKKSAGKREGSLAQYIKDAIESGRRDVDKILDSAKAKFPKAKPTRGYIRWLAKGLKVKMDETVRAKAKTEKKKKKSKPKASKKADESPAIDPAS